MTDNENILNDQELENQIPSTPLRKSAIHFLEDIKISHELMDKLETSLNSPIYSLLIAIKEIDRSLYKYPYTVPYEIIKTANEHKALATKQIADVAFTLSQLKSYDKYKEVYNQINKKDGE